jgi:hypothetical protein
MEEPEVEEIRSADPNEAFITYLADHLEERFWQAVRNLSG